MRNELIKYEREKVLSIANLCATYIEHYDDYIKMRYALKQFSDAFNLEHMIVFDTLGYKLYDSKTLLFEFEAEPKRVMLKEAFDRLPLPGQLIQDNDIFLFHNTEPPFYLYTSLAFSYTQVFDKFFKWYIFYITISLLFLGFLGIFLIRNLFLPMRYVARLADDMGVEMKEEDFVPATFNEIYKKIKTKEETLVEFSSYIAHEFRNSIAAIIGLARLVAKGKKPAADIVTECRLMENLINRLLEYAQPLKKVSVQIELDKLMSEAIERAMIPKRIKVNLALSENANQFYGDQDLLSAAFTNLLQNSVAAIDSEGVIDIESQKRDDHIIIIVQDNGQGMSAQTISNIFKPFYSEVEGGMGLGLAYVNKIVEIHHGRISVESKKGKGTKFTLSFPIED